jgi:hypothetical protein
MSLSGEKTKELLATAAQQNRLDGEKMKRLHVIYEALLRIPAAEGFDRLDLINDAHDEFEDIKALEALDFCIVSQHLFRGILAGQETAEWGGLFVSFTSGAASISADVVQRERAARAVASAKKAPMAAHTIIAGSSGGRPSPSGDQDGLTGRVLRRKLQADQDLQRRERDVADDLKKVDSTAVAKRNVECSRSENKAQLEAFRAELQVLLKSPATKETAELDVARLAYVTSRRLAQVQKESKKNAARKDGRGDHRMYFEKDRDALIEAIEKRIRRMEEIEARFAFRESEEKSRLDRAKKTLKGIDVAILAGEKSVLEIHNKRELELAQMEADAVVDEMLFRQLTNATGKDFHANIREHEQAFLKHNRKLVALHGGGGSSCRHSPHPPTDRGGWLLHQGQQGGYAAPAPRGSGEGEAAARSPGRGVHDHHHLPDIKKPPEWSIVSPRRGHAGKYAALVDGCL